ncbi:MAG: carbohydrate ABC transporter permease [Blautia sp.]|jgi:raffinose/stachyose/melibiose transport system permease protein
MAASKKKKKVGIDIFIHIILLLLVFICLFPIALVVINSLKANAEIVRNPLSFPKILQLGNYISAWTTGKFANGFKNSIELTGCTILIILICATLAGYVLSAKRIKGSGGVLMYFMMAMTVPIQLFLFPLYYAYAKMGLIGNIPATSLILAAVSMPLAVFLMRTFFLAVPKELEEAARIDGAGTFQVIWNVMRPVVSPGLITVGVIVGLQAWNEYLISSTFLQGEKNFTATLGFLSMNGSYGSNMGILMASAVILILPIVIFFLIAQKWFVDGMVSGAVKG